MIMPSLKGKKVIITGATGFVGANLVRMALEAGAEVDILTRRNSNMWRIKDLLEDINNNTLDLLDYNETTSIISSIKPDIIYHLATYGGKPNQDDLCRIIQTNFISTVNLIQACKKVNFELFVNTGSSSEYGIKANPMREYDCPEPINNYGVSKCAATLYCQTEAKKEKLPIVTLRLFSPYGNYEESARLIPSVIMACLRGESPRISSPRFVRDFIYIEDVINSYARLINAPDISGQIFNVGSGKSHSIGEVANIIIGLTGSRVELLTGREQIWPNEPENWQADISKAKHVLGWKPQYDLDQGLRASIKWFEENIELYNHT